MKYLIAGIIMLVFVMDACAQSDEVGIFPKLFSRAEEPDTSIYDVSQSQDYALDQLSFSLGAGLDFAGFGARFNYHPSEQTSFFASIGYYLVDATWNVGVRRRFLTDDTWNIQPHLLATYGTNTWALVASDPEKNKDFDGFTFGLGFQSKWRESKVGYMTLSLMFAVESNEAKTYSKYLKDQFGYESKQLLPIRFGISLGYHFVLKRFSKNLIERL